MSELTKETDMKVSYIPPTRDSVDSQEGKQYATAHIQKRQDKFPILKRDLAPHLSIENFWEMCFKVLPIITTVMANNY